MNTTTFAFVTLCFIAACSASAIYNAPIVKYAEPATYQYAYYPHAYGKAYDYNYIAPYSYAHTYAAPSYVHAYAAPVEYTAPIAYTAPAPVTYAAEGIFDHEKEHTIIAGPSGTISTSKYVASPAVFEKSADTSVYPNSYGYKYYY